MRTTTRQHIRIAAASLAGAAIFSSCGIGGGAAATSELSEADKSRIAEEFRDCLVAGGLDGEVSFEGGGLDVSIEGGEGTSDEEMMIVAEECEQILSAVDSGQEIDPEDQARLIDATADIQRCLDETGYVVEVGTDGGISLDSDDQPEGFDEAEYLIVEEACLREVVPDLYEKYGEDNG